MIEVYSYSKGQDKIRKSEITKLTGKTWVRIFEPDPDKIKLAALHTGIPVEEFQESLEEEERPKVSVKSYLEIIYRAPNMVDNELETTPIYFYLMSDMLVTIEKKRLKIIDDTSARMTENKNKFLFKKGFPYFISFIMDKINDEYLLNIDKIASRIDIYENFSKKELTVQDIEKVYDHSVTLSFFNQALIANVEVLNSLRKGFFKMIPKTQRQLFEELYFDILQILDTERIQRDAISNLMNVHSILASHRLNEFMKKLTIIAIIMAIPTMISGIYGMNFRYIPLSEHPYGFYITSFIIILVTAIIYYLFARKR